nr:papilin-like [Dermacentor andersoni]
MRPLRGFLLLLLSVNCVQAWFKKSPKVEKKQPPFCTKPPFLGSCQPLTQTWYYNSTEKRCTPSSVGFCIGGTNRFVSEKKCKETCESPSKATPSNTMCFKPPVTVSCGQVEHAWFFDPNTSTCKMFTYIASACGSVSNKFWTEMKCQAVCLPTKKPQITCSQDPVLDFCLAQRKKWFFNFSNNTCMQFQKGCGRSANSFSTYEKCMEKCSYNQIAAAFPTSGQNLQNEQPLGGIPGVPSQVGPPRPPAQLSIPVQPGQPSTPGLGLSNQPGHSGLPIQSTGSGVPGKPSPAGAPGSASSTFPPNMSTQSGPSSRPDMGLPNQPALSGQPAQSAGSGLPGQASSAGAPGPASTTLPPNPPAQSASFQTSSKVEKKQPPLCTKPPFIGSCRPLPETWYYNSTEKRCTPLSVGFCNGGSNKFLSEKKCKDTCLCGQAAAASPSSKQKHPNELPSGGKPSVPDLARPSQQAQLHSLPILLYPSNPAYLKDPDK